jgi:hypothetical protein
MIFLEKILYHKRAENYVEAKNEIDNTINILLGINPLILYNYTVDEILVNIIGLEPFDLDKCVIIAQLLNEKAEVLEKTSKSYEILENYKKSFLLFREALKHDLDIIKYKSKIDSIIDSIRKYEIPDEINIAIMEYYENVGDFGKAEDVLFLLKEAGYKDIQTLGVGFYNRILKLKDEELEKGNLPRKEAKEALKVVEKL